MSVNIKQYFHKSCQLQSPFAWLIIVYYTLLIKFDRDLSSADRTKLVINNVISNKAAESFFLELSCLVLRGFFESPSLETIIDKLESKFHTNDGII